jgi:hypothetical protein
LRIVENQIVVEQELARGLRARQVQPVQVDDRAAGQDQPQRLELVLRELVQPLQARSGPGAQRALFKNRATTTPRSCPLGRHATGRIDGSVIGAGGVPSRRSSERDSAKEDAHR